VSTPYQRGAAFEHRVKAELEAQGYLVTRSPASKSPFDLLALHWRGDLRSDWGHNGAALLIQCKLRGVIAKREIEELCALAWAHAAEPVLAFTLQPRGLVHYRIYAPDGRPPVDWSP
jgi:Holliday junction resolvase